MDDGLAAMDDGLAAMDATAVAGMVTRREASAVDMVTAALARLDDVDPRLRAFRDTWPDQALATARAVDRAVARGERPRLAGVPIAVKAWQRIQAPQTERLRREGCVVMGLTSVPRPSTDWQTWGHTDRGPTLNPWRADRTPGGSSAGSAAAVAAGIVPLATGSDGAGSLRIPAAWCGVLALKPTNGRVPTRDPSGLAALGAVVRTARDAALHLSVLLDEPFTVDEDVPAGLRAAWSTSLGFAAVDPEQAAVARAAADRLSEAGVITWRPGPVRLLDPEPAWREMRERPSPSAAAQLRSVNDARLREVFDRADVLLTPATPIPAHGHAGPGTALSVSLTWGFNVSGHPAISIPAGLGRDGTPVGLQVVAPHGHEATLLRVAAAVERHAPWPVLASNSPSAPAGSPARR
ncbi:amidase [Actinomadura miaoliensis]|uniref:Amidase n=1 Tax=Actinomadura miaoliensis TaxID=430685 RepID=A0ABP7VLG1_9ACTN